MLFCLWNIFCNFYISTSRSLWAMHNMAVFCGSLILCWYGMLLKYYLNDFEIVPVAHIITGITIAFTFHICWISVMRSFCFKIFSASFLITFVSLGIATSIDIYVPFFIIINYDVWFTVRNSSVVRTCWLLSWPVSTNFGTCFY